MFATSAQSVSPRQSRAAGGFSFGIGMFDTPARTHDQFNCCRVDALIGKSSVHVRVCGSQAGGTAVVQPWLMNQVLVWLPVCNQKTAYDLCSAWDCRKTEGYFYLGSLVDERGISTEAEEDGESSSEEDSDSCSHTFMIGKLSSGRDGAAAVAVVAPLTKCCTK